MSKGPAKRDTRATTIVHTAMRGTCTPHQKIVIRNLSRSGAEARASAQPPEPDEAVVIIIEPGVELPAVVKWVRGSLFGVMFATPVDVDRLARNGARWN